MLSASWCIVRRNGHHDDGKVLLLRCFLLLSCHHVLHSRIRRCLQRPAPHVEAVVQARKKKVLVHGLLQRVHPRLVGSSRETFKRGVATSYIFCPKPVTTMFVISSEYQPPPISRTAISGSFFSTTSKKRNPKISL